MRRASDEHCKYISMHQVRHQQIHQYKKILHTEETQKKIN